MSHSRFEINGKLFLLSLFILLLFYILPTPDGLTYAGKMMIGIMVFAIFIFVTETLPLGMAGLLIMALPPILRIYDSSEVFGFFGNEAIFLLISAFILAAGFHKSGLHRRIASKFIKKFGKGPKKYILGIILLGASLSLLMSEHAVVALMIPLVALSLVDTKDENLKKAGMIALAYGCSIGSIGTLLGGARNPYTVSFLQDDYGINVTFFQWFTMAAPVLLLMIPVIWLILISVFPAKPQKIGTNIPESNGPLQKNELLAGSIIIGTIVLLFLAGSIGTAVITIIGATAMFLLGVIDWKDVEKAIPWGVLLLYGGAITIGKGMLSTGASDWIALRVIWEVSASPAVILLLLIIMTVFLTELMSNTAAVALMLPIGAGLSATLPGLNLLVTSMAIALAGGFAFALVLGTPGNLITYGTGYYRQKDIFKSGLLADIWGIFAIYVVAMTVWKFMGAWSI